MNEKLMCIYIISSKACVLEIHVVYLKKSITFTNSNLIFDLRSGLRLRLPCKLHVTIHETKHRHIVRMFIQYHEN